MGWPAWRNTARIALLPARVSAIRPVDAELLGPGGEPGEQRRAEPACCQASATTKATSAADPAL